MAAEPTKIYRTEHIVYNSARVKSRVGEPIVNSSLKKFFVARTEQFSSRSKSKTEAISPPVSGKHVPSSICDAQMGAVIFGKGRWMNPGGKQVLTGGPSGSPRIADTVVASPL